MGISDWSADVCSSDRELRQHMMIDTTARNKLTGVIRQIRPGAVNDEIILGLNDDTHIVASITSESAQSLGLRPGKRALAFIKASSVLIGLTGSGMSLSAQIGRASCRERVCQYV